MAPASFSRIRPFAAGPPRVKGTIRGRFSPVPGQCPPQSALISPSFVTRALAAVAPEEPPDALVLERPRDPAHGDFATNAAMQLARDAEGAAAQARRTPRGARCPASDWIEPPEIAGPGFINFRLKPAAKQGIVRTILRGGRGLRPRPTAAPDGA